MISIAHTVYRIGPHAAVFLAPIAPVRGGQLLVTSGLSSTRSAPPELGRRIPSAPGCRGWAANEPRQRGHGPPRAGLADRASTPGIPAGWGIHRPAASGHWQVGPEAAPGPERSGTMTRQARSSAVIMDLDTHMILGTVPAPPSIRQNACQDINRTSRHYVGALPLTPVPFKHLTYRANSLSICRSCRSGKSICRAYTQRRLRLLQRSRSCRVQGGFRPICRDGSTCAAPEY